MLGGFFFHVSIGLGDSFVGLGGGQGFFLVGFSHFLGDLFVGLGAGLGHFRVSLGDFLVGLGFCLQLVFRIGVSHFLGGLAVFLVGLGGSFRHFLVGLVLGLRYVFIDVGDFLGFLVLGLADVFLRFDLRFSHVLVDGCRRGGLSVGGGGEDAGDQGCEQFIHDWHLSMWFALFSSCHGSRINFPNDINRALAYIATFSCFSYLVASGTDREYRSMVCPMASAHTWQKASLRSNIRHCCCER